MKVNIRFLFLAVILSLIIFGCSRSGNVEDIQRTSLEISNMSTGIGSVDTNNNSHDIQRFSYSINLANNDKDTAFIKEVTLVLPKEFEETLVTKQLTVTVNKEIATTLTKGQHRISFWYGMFPPEDEVLKIIKRNVGENFFPIIFESISIFGLKSIAGTLEGLYHYDENELIKLVKID